jgi:predicted Zn-dependent protease
VIGHEITHSAARHAAAQQEIASRTSPLAMPYVRMAKVAAYGREQERDADQGGQFLANAAGYNPMGMSTFLRKLGNVERQKIGYSRLQGYFDTHPGSSERAATAADRAHGAQTGPNATFGAPQATYLRRLDGLVLGTNPAEGVFLGSVFVQPDLGFHMRFPTGWRMVNSHQAVGASSPRGDAMIFLMVEGKGTEAKQGAQTFTEKHGEEYGLEVAREGPVKVGEIDSWRIEGTGWMQGQKVAALLTFVPFRGLIYRITAISPPGSADKFVGRSRAATRSFGPITKQEMDSMEILTLRVVSAEAGESLRALGKRTRNAYGEQDTAILNGIFTDKRFREGDLVKIARAKPYRPSGRTTPSGG